MEDTFNSNAALECMQRTYCNNFLKILNYKQQSLYHFIKLKMDHEIFVN